MNPEIKQIWIEALESGDYAKGKHLLKDSRDEYCCLGVACALYKLRINPQAEFLSGGNEFMYSQYEYIPEEVSIWLGLPKETAETGYGKRIKTQVKLAEINDSNDSFKPVIEYIKENL